MRRPDRDFVRINHLNKKLSMEKEIINKIIGITTFSVLISLVLFKVLDYYFPESDIVKNILIILNAVGI